jgi:hypothetical protein
MPVPIRRSALALLLFAAGLTGCLSDRAAEPAPAPRVTAPAPETLQAAPRVPGLKPAVPADIAALNAVSAPKPLPPRPPRRPAFPRIEAAALVGLTAEQALTLFGTPDRSLRSQGDVTGETIWVYETAGCRLEIAFHFSIADDALVAHARDLRPSDPAAPVPESICLHVLAGRTAGPPAQG